MRPRRKANRRPRRNWKRRSAGLLKRDVAQVTSNLGQTMIDSSNLFSMENFSLSSCPRAKAVAAAYQYYRIKKVTLKFKPIYDTFQLGASSTVTVPYLYWMIDRHSIFNGNATLATLKSAGAKPHRLDDKTITVNFAPSVANASVTSYGQGTTPVAYGPGSYKISPWLSTNANSFQQQGVGPTGQWAPDSTDHAGIVFGVEQYSAPTPGSVCQVEVIIEYEFKKRFFDTGPSDSTVQVIDVDTMTVVPPPAPVQEASK